MPSLVPRFVLHLEDIEGLDCSSSTRASNNRMLVPLWKGTHQPGSRTLPKDGELTPPCSRSDECLERRGNRTVGTRRERRSTAAAILQPSCRQRCNNVVPRKSKIIHYTGRQPPRHPGRHRHLCHEELQAEPAIANPVADSLDHEETASTNGNGAQGSRAVCGVSASTRGDVYHENASRFARHCRQGRQGHHQLAASSAAPWACSALDSLVSKGIVGSRVRAGEDSERIRHGVDEGLTREARSRVEVSPSAPTLRRTSMSLRGDLEDTARKVCQLHERLKMARTWTERLIRERNASRKEIDTLRAQVRKLVPGGGTSSFSQTDEASMAMDDRHQDDEGHADTDLGGSNEGVSGSASESGENMVPMYTPSATHVSPPEGANATRDGDAAEEADVPKCSDRSRETEERSSDLSGKDTYEDPDRGIESVRRHYANAESPAEARRNSEEIFSSSEGKACGHGMGLATEATTARSGSFRGAQTTNTGDGARAHSEGSSRRREALKSHADLSNGDEDVDLGTRSRWKEEEEPRQRSVGQRGRQHGRGSPPLSKKKSKRHGGGKGKRLGRKSTGNQTPLLWETIAVDATESGPDPAEAEEMLQTLAGLSAELRRVSLVDDAEGCHAMEPLRKTCTVVNDGGLAKVGAEDGFQEREASVDRPTGEVPTTDASWGSPSRCERCALLSDAIEDARGRAKLLERLLLEQSRHTPLPQDNMLPQQTTLGRAETEATVGDAVSATNVEDSTRSREVDKKEVSDPTGVKQELGGEGVGCGGKEASEELLAAAEAVWRVSEMARDVLEGELDRRGEALAVTKRTAKEANEAFSKQLQELSDARATMRSQRAEVDRWKSEAEKSNAKERDARRALECARVTAGDTARRSEREAKALRAETEDLRRKVSSLRTKLACAQGRHQAELGMANKKIEQLEHNLIDHERALAHRQQRQHHQVVGHRETWCHAARLPPGRPSEDSGVPSRGRMGSTSRGPEETSRDDISRQRTRGAKYDFSCDAAAIVSERSRVIPGGAGSFASGRPFPEDYYYYNGERKAPSSWVRSETREGGVNAEGTRYADFTEDRFEADDDNMVREKSTAPARSRTSALAQSSSKRGIATESGEAGGRSSFVHAACGSRSSLLESENRPSSRKSSQRITRGRRVSLATSAVDERDLWKQCLKKARRVSAPEYVERVAMADRQADRDRVLRRASQSHRPPSPTQDPSLAAESALSGRSSGSIGSDSGGEQYGEHRSRQQDRLQSISSATTGADCVEFEERGRPDLRGTPARGAADITAEEETSHEVVDQTSESPRQRK